MKSSAFILFFALLPAAFADSDLDRGLLGLFQRERAPSPAERPPELDAKRIVNQSNSFLKEREPELTSEEYAVYEKVATLLTTSPELALRMLETMMTEKEPPNPAFAFVLGNAYYGAQQLDRAEQNYRSAVQRYPTFLRAWNNLGILYYTSGRFAEAVPCFSKSVALGEHDPITFGLLGYCLEKEGDTVAAETAYLQAVSGDAGNTEWKEGLLRIYLDGKQYGRAEALVRNLIKKKPTETRYWLDYAGICLAQRRQPQAMIVLEEAIAAGAAGPDELMLLGDLYAEHDLTAAAVSIYEKILAAKPALGERKLLQFARVLVAAGRLTEAEQTLARLPGELPEPERLALWQTRADLLMARSRWPEARHEIEALLALAPLDGQGLLTLGRTYLEEGNLPRATLAFEAAGKIPASAYAASIELANVELKNRHYARAVEYLEQAQSLRKNDAIADYLSRVRALVPRDRDSG